MVSSSGLTGAGERGAGVTPTWRSHPLADEGLPDSGAPFAGSKLRDPLTLSRVCGESRPLTVPTIADCSDSGERGLAGGGRSCFRRLAIDRGGQELETLIAVTQALSMSASPRALP